MSENKPVRAVDAMVEPTEPGPDADPLFMEETDGLLMRLFGMVPDYNDKRLDLLFDRVCDMDKKKVFAYCLEQGVDVLDDDGKPVEPWRDIAVVLMAVEKGILDAGDDDDE